MGEANGAAREEQKMAIAGQRSDSGLTAKQVKVLADECGLPCRIGKYDIISPLSTLEALSLDREWRKYYPHEYPKPKVKTNGQFNNSNT